MQKTIHRGREARLLTEEEKRAAVCNLFKVKEAPGNRESVFLPSAHFYMLLRKPDGLELAAGQLCGWLGLTGGFNIRITATGKQAVSVEGASSDSTITLRADYAANPYQAAALLAHAIVGRTVALHDEFRYMSPVELAKSTDMAIAQCGFGVIMLNGLNYHAGWTDRAWRRIKSLILPGAYRLPVGFYPANQFALLVLDHARNNGADLREMAQYLLPWARPFLPADLRMLIRRRHDRPGYVLDGERLVRRRNTLSACIVAGAVLSLGSILVYQKLQAPAVPPELIEQREKILTLQRMYELCAASVERKRRETDQSDLLTEGAVNAHANTCISIANRYNYERDQYRAALDDFRRKQD